MNSDINNQPTDRTRSRLKLLAIFAVVALPIMAAWVMAQFSIGIPTDRNNRSDLVEPAVNLDDWGVILDPVGYGAPWRLTVTTVGECQSECMELIHEARQINVALGREAARVQHLLLTAQQPATDLARRLEQDYPRLGQASLDAPAYNHSLRDHPDAWTEGPQLWLIDPLGRVVLRHDPAQPAKRLLDDLKYLLKVSKVG